MPKTGFLVSRLRFWFATTGGTNRNTVHKNYIAIQARINNYLTSFRGKNVSNLGENVPRAAHKRGSRSLFYMSNELPSSLEYECVIYFVLSMGVKLGKGKGKVTLFNVGSSFSNKAGINGSRRCALYPPPSVSAPFYGYLKL